MKNRPLRPVPLLKPLFAERARPGIQFTETMRGRFAWDGDAARSLRPENDIEPWRRAVASKDAAEIQFTVTVLADDIEKLVSSRRHAARLVGTVTACELSDVPMSISGGTFNLFIVDADRVETRYMRYCMTVRNRDDIVCRIEGKKIIRNSSCFDMWRALTTLYVTIQEEGGQRRCALGILTLSARDFSRQLTTIRTRHTQGLIERLDVQARLLGFFLDVSRAMYGRMLARSTLATPDAPPRARRPPPREPVWYEVPTSDTTRIHLARYRGGSRGPVMLSPGFSVRAASFVADTVDENLVEHLFKQQYDIWLFDYRASSGFAAAGTNFSIDDIALRDYPAAVHTILKMTQRNDLQIVAHCVGSMSLLMSLLAGKLEGVVRSAICSQLGLHPIAPRFAELKASLYLASLLRRLGVATLTAHFDPYRLTHRIADKLLTLYPTEERCNNPACRRILLLFGESFRHDQLNTATHEAIDDWFGTTSVPALAHLSLMLRAGHVVDRDGRNVYLPNLWRLALPISFVHGTLNREFLPPSTKKTYELLCKNNGDGLYVWEPLEGYGHMDCFIGKNAATAVFPIIARELEQAPQRRDRC